MYKLQLFNYRPRILTPTVCSGSAKGADKEKLSYWGCISIECHYWKLIFSVENLLCNYSEHFHQLYAFSPSFHHYFFGVFFLILNTFSLHRQLQYKLWRNGFIKRTVPRDGGRDGTIEQYYRPIKKFVNTFFCLKIGRFKAKEVKIRVLSSGGYCYKSESNWQRTAIALSWVLIWPKRSGSN
jgi:hypothetical protein